MNYEVKFTLRIMEDAMQKLRIIENKNLRSVNKEIEFIINKYIEENKEIIEEENNKNKPDGKIKNYN